MMRGESGRPDGPSDPTHTTASAARWSPEPGWRPIRYYRGRGSATHAAAPIGASAEVGKEQPDLALGGLIGVRAVHDVVLHLEGEVAADRAGCGLHGVGRAGQRSERLDGARALGDDRQQRAAGDEVD